MIGPRARAGTKVSAPTSTTTLINSTTNNGVYVARVPGPAGTSFFLASDPAYANVAIANQKREISITSPPVTL